MSVLVEKWKRTDRRAFRSFPPWIPNDVKMSSDMVQQRLCAAVDTLDGAVLIERYG